MKRYNIVSTVTATPTTIHHAVREEEDANGPWVKWGDAREASLQTAGVTAREEAWSAVYWAAKKLGFHTQQGECARDGVVRFIRELHAKAEKPGCRREDPFGGLLWRYAPQCRHRVWADAVARAARRLAIWERHRGAPAGLGRLP